jgi:coiled-coil domain-containing protein 55
MPHRQASPPHLCLHYRTPHPLGHFAPTMSLKYGLNLKKAAPPKKRTLLDDEPDEDEEDDNVLQDQPAEEAIDSFGISAPKKGLGLNVPARTKPQPKPKPGLSSKPPSKRFNLEDEESRQDASAMAASKNAVKAAEEIDASIFDYDSFHDAKSTVIEAKKEATRQDAIDRKPKYINNLLDAAARRKQDQQIAREKQLQRERENEGDEFADKEKFVTSAYKQQQEETRKLEEEEKKRAEEEEKRKRQMGGGMQSFYRNMMDQSEKLHQDEIDAAMKLEREGGVKNVDEQKKRTDAELAAELLAKGIKVHVNEDGAITDKRDLLTAGLNVAPAGKSADGSNSADHLRSSNRPAQSAFPRKDAGSREAQRERQSRMVEEQLEASAKRKREEEDEQRAKEERDAKSKKTEKDVGDAKARYLARKAAKEKAQG